MAVVVYASQNWRNDPVVRIEVSRESEMSPDEARSLADDLLNTANIAEAQS